MKKIFFLLLMLAAAFQGAMAQNDNSEFYAPGKRIGLSIGFGAMDGVSIEASTSLTKWCSARAGIDIAPSIKANFSGSYSTSVQNLSPQAKALVEQALAKEGMPTTLPGYVDWNLNSNFARTQGHILFDAYPFPNKSNFFVTAGFYFGGSSVISADVLVNKEVIVARDALLNSQYRDEIRNLGINLNDIESLPFDENGMMKAYASINNFRPYVGLGFGRIIPKHRIGCRFEMGVQFSGKPSLLYKENGETKNFLESDILKKDRKDIEDIINKITVMPVIKFAICGRIL